MGTKMSVAETELRNLQNKQVYIMKQPHGRMSTKWAPIMGGVMGGV